MTHSAFGLSEQIRLSPMESRVLGILEQAERSKTLSTMEVVEKLYVDNKPCRARESVLATLRSLQVKINADKRAGLALVSSSRAGPRPIEWTLSERNPSRAEGAGDVS